MMQLSLVTPTKKLVTDTEVTDIHVPAYLGEINILEGHADLMTTLSTGVMKFKSKDSNAFRYIAISSGYCEVSNNTVNVLAETAEESSEIDYERAVEALKRAEAKVQETGTDPEQIEKHQWKIERAMTRIAVSKMKS